MPTQTQLFNEGEADAWFKRNKHAYDRCAENTTINLLKAIELTPRSILEIGCSNGTRLQQMRDAFSCDCFGIDPSAQAIEDGRNAYKELQLRTGTADALPFADNSFDTVIFGFCLYLCDRKDLFKIAFEADRVLKDKGSIVITDFEPPFPYKNPYIHRPGIYSYKQSYSKMFTWCPHYVEVSRAIYGHMGFQQRDIPNERISTVVLRKNMEVAYIESPFK
jgi:ubiquinone/menaquinone biosynthesis C-methylase UbiE